MHGDRLKFLIDLFRYFGYLAFFQSSENFYHWDLLQVALATRHHPFG
ncbi:hypothetical protein XACLH37_3170003 [Xanthomonas citri pv. citri]|nr:hypothetical protein XACLH37_3170003 [Xanthomonas citri pv. citri]